jgi:hypothetical protein
LPSILKRQRLVCTKTTLSKQTSKNMWYKTRVVYVDCSLVRLHFQETNHCDRLFRGSYRLQSFYENFKNEEIELIDSLSAQNSAMKLDSESDLKQCAPYISAYSSTVFPLMQKQTARISTAERLFHSARPIVVGHHPLTDLQSKCLHFLTLSFSTRSFPCCFSIFKYLISPL